MDSLLTDGSNNERALTTKDITLIATLSALLFAQEEALTFLPNIQLTVFLLVIYSKKIGFLKTSIIILIHVILDNLVMGSFNLVYTPAMFLGLMTIPVFVCFFLKKTNSCLLLALCGVICSFLYCWMFVLPSFLVYNIQPLIYLTSDILFEIIMAACSFITIICMYKPCERIFDHLRINKKKESISNKHNY